MNMMYVPFETRNPNKRMRTGAQPSKVLHVRGLPQNCVQGEIANICYHTGQVIKCLVLGERNQAFVEVRVFYVAPHLWVVCSCCIYPCTL